MYCHSYDLSGKMQDQHEGWIDSNGGTSNCISIINDNCDCDSASQSQDLRSSAFQLFHVCRKHIDDQIRAKPSTLLIMNPPPQKVAIALPLLLSHIRHHSLPVVLLVTIRPWIHPSGSRNRSSSSCISLSSTPSQSHAQALISLRRTCDAVMTFDGFAAMVTPPPSEFSDLAGIMTIRKMALQSLAHFADSTTNRRPPAHRYGMKRDRRKMHIRMLHLPPEDFTSSAGGRGSGSGAGTTSSTSSDSGNIGSSSKKGSRTALQPGMSCATTGGSSSSSLDF